MKTSHLHALACTKTVTEILQNCRLKITASGIWPTQTHQIKKSKKFSIGNVVLESRFSGIYFKLSELRALARTKPVTDLDTFFSIFAKSAFQDGPDLVGVRQSKVEYRLRSPLAFGQINFDSVANIQDFQWLKSAFITFLFNWYFKFSDGWFSDGVFGPTLNSTQGCLFHTEIDCDLPKDKDGKQCSFFPKFSTIRLCVFEIVGSDLSIKRNHSFDWINPFRFEISWALSTISFRETAPWLNKTVWSRVFYSFQLDGSKTSNETNQISKFPWMWSNQSKKSKVDLNRSWSQTILDLMHSFKIGRRSPWTHAGKTLS